MDLKLGYYQIEMEEESLGLKEVTHTFTRAMSLVMLGGFEGKEVVIYFIDLKILRETLDLYNQRH